MVCAWRRCSTPVESPSGSLAVAFVASGRPWSPEVARINYLCVSVAANLLRDDPRFVFVAVCLLTSWRIEWGTNNINPYIKATLGPTSLIFRGFWKGVFFDCFWFLGGPIRMIFGEFRMILAYSAVAAQHTPYYGRSVRCKR